VAEHQKAVAESTAAQEQRTVEQLKLALELERLTAQTGPATVTNQGLPTQSTDPGAENSINRSATIHPEHCNFVSSWCDTPIGPNTNAESINMK
jgi:hypothetical protein